MNSFVRKLLILGVLLLVASVASAQIFRIGSAAPENSPWGRALNRIAADWQEISNGRVRVQVFHNSIAGIESDMVRKMRIGQLQAVVMTSAGLSEFSESILTVSMPLLMRTQDEYNHVFERIQDDLEAEVEDDGFRVLSWSNAGWLHFFTKTPVRVPADLQGQKLAASPDEMGLVRAYQLMGYQPIPISYAERLAALASGMVNAYMTVPILSAGFQWFGATPYMLDLPVGPAPGAIVMSERAYRMLPAAHRDEMLARARELAAGLDTDILELERNAIDTMVEFGLTVVEPTEAERQEWIAEFERSYDLMLGLVFERDLYQQIEGILRDYRNR
ncbi:MAG: TRAP transporter substrate-binding protein DctP [Spirochaetota bacterium]